MCIPQGTVKKVLSKNEAGHTPTQNIEENPNPGYIYRVNNHIAIDCGACFGGRLAAFCLDTGEEFYVESRG